MIKNKARMMHWSTTRRNLFLGYQQSRPGLRTKVVSRKAPKGNASSTAFQRELHSQGGTLLEFVAFCETARHVHLKIKEDVAYATATFENMKTDYSRAQALLSPKESTAAATQIFLVTILKDCKGTRTDISCCWSAVAPTPDQKIKTTHQTKKQVASSREAEN